MRSVVSKKKKRFVDDKNGINLDLSYITKNIIAMGFPTQGKESYYRNPLSQVQLFFELRHAGHFKVYNLCGEKKRKYDHKIFTKKPLNGEVAEYGFSDHNVCELSYILQFCKDVKDYLDKHPKNTVAIHCKAGKGRTGMMISCYLLYAGIKSMSGEAMKMFAKERTSDLKGVTIPSQRRFVEYFNGYVLKNKNNFKFAQKCILKKIIIQTVPNFDYGGGCDPYFTIMNSKGEEIFNYKNLGIEIKHFSKTKKKENNRIFENIKCPLLSGAFKIVFWDQDFGSSDDIMCWCWFDSTIAGLLKEIHLSKNEIDNAVKDKKHKHFKKDFKLKFLFEPIQQK